MASPLPSFPPISILFLSFFLSFVLWKAFKIENKSYFYQAFPLQRLSSLQTQNSSWWKSFFIQNRGRKQMKYRIKALKKCMTADPTISENRKKKPVLEGQCLTRGPFPQTASLVNMRLQPNTCLEHSEPGSNRGWWQTVALYVGNHKKRELFTSRKSIEIDLILK